MDALLAEARAVPPGADGLVFLPYLAGERSPLWDPSARGVFAGLTLRHTRAHLVRAILEAAALAIRHVAAPMLEAGIVVRAMRVCGGPARDDGWNQIKADVTGFSVEVPRVRETATVGAAIVAAVGAGVHPDLSAAIRAMTLIDRRFEPNPDRRARLRRPVRGVHRAPPGGLADPARARAGSRRRGPRRIARERRHDRAGPRRPIPNGSRPMVPGRIELRGVGVSFPAGRQDRLVALDGLDLVVEPGEIVALIGPNGSGKSTLLRVVAGLLVPDAGSAEIDGRPIEGPDPRVGLVFQEPRLLPWRTTAANVAYPLELANMPRADRRARVATLLATVGLEAAAAQIPSELSGGMRQRAALARTLALAPEVLLLDEPFSALDELTRERLNLELLAITARTPTTVLLVTHSVQEAIFLADRVVVLSARPGRVVADLRVTLPRPRSLGDLDAAVVSSTAREIRAALGEEAA